MTEEYYLSSFSSHTLLIFLPLNRAILLCIYFYYTVLNKKLPQTYFWYIIYPTMLKDYHHFKGNDLTRSEKIQRLVTEMIMESRIPDGKRENSIVWELKHSAGVVAVGRILAIKRGLDVELAEIICSLHDIYAIVEGKYKDHARLGSVIAENILKDLKDFSREEIETITKAIANHSDKDLYTDNPYIELAKDADVFECSLYQGAEGFYRLHKPEKVYQEYVLRIIKVRKELSLPPDNIFRE